MAYTGQIHRTTLTQEIRWGRCFKECFWGMGEVRSVLFTSSPDWATEERCGGEAVNGSPAPLKWRCVGQRCREEQHLCPINQSHQNHIITTFSDTLIILLHMDKKNKSRVGEDSEKALSHNSLCLLLLPTHNYWLLVLSSWHEVSSSDSCCNWSKWDVKLLCMQFLWSHIHGWLEYLTLIGQSLHSENLFV